MKTHPLIRAYIAKLHRQWIDLPAEHEKDRVAARGTHPSNGDR